MKARVFTFILALLLVGIVIAIGIVSGMLDFKKKQGKNTSPPSSTEPLSTRDRLEQLEQALIQDPVSSKSKTAITKTETDLEKKPELSDPSLAVPDTEEQERLPAITSDTEDELSASEGVGIRPKVDGLSAKSSIKERPSQSKLPADIKLPPYIPSKLFYKENPDRTLEKGYMNPARALSSAEQPSYKDLQGLDPDYPWNQRLLEALHFAQLDYGLLLPRQGESQLNWQQPITRRTLAQWLVTFTEQPRLTARPKISQFEDIDIKSRDYTTLAQTVDKGWLRPFAPEPDALAKKKAKAAAEGKPFDASQPLLPSFQPNGLFRRQELCMLYLKLSQQENYVRQALQEGREDYSDWLPANADAFDYPTQFADWSQVAPTYQGAVALSYRDGLLEKVFALTPTELKRQGLRPNLAVSRAEALIFFHQLAMQGRLTGRHRMPKAG